MRFEVVTVMSLKTGILDSVDKYSMYQYDWSSLELDYIHKYGKQNYKY